MYSFLNVWKNSGINPYLLIQLRYKSKTHWAKLKKKNTPKYKALSHFDEFYGSFFGKKWEPMREALFRKSKYVALINNYGDAEETIEYLSNRGAHCLKNLMLVQENFHKQYSPNKENTNQSAPTNNLNEYISRLQSEEISNIYPRGNEVPDRLETSSTVSLNSKTYHEEEKETMSKSVTLNEALEEAHLDETRIINPQMGVSSESLYQYIPATKLKGMEEWIPDSMHFSFYAENSTEDFPLVIEPETDFEFPEHLKVMTYEKDSECTKFPEPKRGQTGVFNYYPLDLGSVAAVLALSLRGGERVLDMCAAPGGKSLAMLQTMLPDILVCNDSSISRANRMERIFSDYLIDYKTGNKWRERLMISHKDGRMLSDDSRGFDKVLVDVPCTTDRHSVIEDENNIFRPDRVKERLRIPEIQSQLLANALRLVRPGGAVVYSTCSLSPAQNDGVVHAGLRLAFHEGILASVRDLSLPFDCLTSALILGSGAAKPKYGQLVIPDVAANFGPSYIARLVRIK